MNPYERAGAGLPRRASLRGVFALTIGAAGLVLVSVGLNDAAPFLFFGTEAEVAQRETGEVMVNVGALLAVLSGVAILTRHVFGGVIAALAGAMPASLLLSALDQSAAPGGAYVLLAPAAAAVLMSASGLRFEVPPLLFVVPVMFVVGAVLFVYAAGPIVGVIGALASPAIFAVARRLA